MRRAPESPTLQPDRQNDALLPLGAGGMLARPRVARPRQRETEPRCNILALVCCAVCIALLSAEDFVRLHTTPPSSVTPRTKVRPIEAREDSPLSPSPPPPSSLPSPQSSPLPPPPPPPPSTHSAKNEASAFPTEPVACSSSRLSTVLAPSCGSEADAEAQADAHDSARLQVCAQRRVQRRGRSQRVWCARFGRRRCCELGSTPPRAPILRTTERSATGVTVWGRRHGTCPPPARRASCAVHCAPRLVSPPPLAAVVSRGRLGAPARPHRRHAWQRAATGERWNAIRQ